MEYIIASFEAYESSTTITNEGFKFLVTTRTDEEVIRKTFTFLSDAVGEYIKEINKIIENKI